MSHRMLVRVTAAAGAIALVVGAQVVLGTAPAGAGGLRPYTDCDEFLAQQRADLRLRATEYGIDGTGVRYEMGGYGRGGIYFLQNAAVALSSPQGVAAQTSSDGAVPENAPTGTNLQEQGVDEPDMAKLADGRIVLVTDGILQVLSAGSAPTVLGSLDVSREAAGILEVLIVGNRAIVIGSVTRPYVDEPTASPTPTAPATTSPPTVTPSPSSSSTTPVTGAPSATASDPSVTAPPPSATAPAGTPAPITTTPVPAQAEVAAATPAVAPVREPIAVADPGMVRNGISVVDDSKRVVTATRVTLVDLSQGIPRVIEERVQDGEYISARLVDGTVRLVTRSLPTVMGVGPQPLDPAAQATATPTPSGAPRLTPEQAAKQANQQAASNAPLSAFLPQFTRTNAAGEALESGTVVSCQDVTHAAKGLTGGMVTVTTMRPDADLAAQDTDAVATDGDTVYAAPDRLYIATSRWGVMPVASMRDAVGLAVDPSGATTPPEVTTEIHAFDTSGQTVTAYVASGSVPGYILNRWAMSRHEGVLRVATTSERDFTNPEVPTESMVVKLKESSDDLVETGRVAGLGKGERITAVRYFGDTATVVTFRQTDPLYLIDLSGTPKLTGELKIPGYSTYLHPIGDDLLLGIGYDGDDNGTITGVQASTFDISDPAKPRQVDRLRLADLGNGSDVTTPALDDSRAFTYDQKRRQLLLPMSVFDWSMSASTQERGRVLGVTVDARGGLSATGSLPLGASRLGAPMRVLLDGDSFHAVGALGMVTAATDSFVPSGRVIYPQPAKAAEPAE